MWTGNNLHGDLRRGEFILLISFKNSSAFFFPSEDCEYSRWLARVTRLSLMNKDCKYQARGRQ